ncbi:xanthine dehydrogenase small subunit [Psychrobacter sp. 1U2]|uniref:xanthine dehydrogenase small subunit n=1 Tax=Psychrobacter sp. 1U2 TaxID=3453577 RepID=UPI003F478BED
MIRFYLNGKPHQVRDLNPNTTVLEYLRLHERQTDTKEGCGSGDCGACTIMAQRLPSQDTNDSAPFYTFNSCITLLSLMDGHHLLTASYLADNPSNHPDRALLHPAQQAMVECHGSQCGFCTPGFVMSLANLYENRRLQTGHDSNANADDTTFSYDEIVASISGNLCRCTGYRPIIDAGLKMQQIGQQLESANTPSKVLSLATNAMANHDSQTISNNQAESDAPFDTIEPALTDGSKQLFIPRSISEFNQLLAVYPTATIWAGGTDLGLTVTQRLMDHEVIIQLSALDELQQWSLSEAADTPELSFGAGMTYQQMLPILEQHFPAFADLFARTASPQIRNMGTLGGNIANASPIGDLPPVLLALEARVHLRHCDVINKEAIDKEASTDNEHKKSFEVSDETISLADFFLDYKKTKLRPGSYVVGVHIPLMQAHQHLFIHKISKRYEDDISACLLAARLDLSADATTITNAKIGLGGMAAIPLLAQHCQQALVGQKLEVASFKVAAEAMPLDVSPMTDVRASREYRMHVVQRLLVKCAKQLMTELQTQGAVL